MANDPEELISLVDIGRVFPWWPWSVWSTGRLIRDGWLDCVRIGRRVYVTPALVRAFITRYTDIAAG